jgi:hypothetical protein
MSRNFLQKRELKFLFSRECIANYQVRITQVQTIFFLEKTIDFRVYRVLTDGIMAVQSIDTKVVNFCAFRSSFKSNPDAIDS